MRFHLSPVLEYTIGHKTIETTDFTSVLVAYNFIHVEILGQHRTVAREFHSLVLHA